MGTATQAQGFAAHGVATPGATLSDWLRRSSEPLWSRMIGHQLDRLGPELARWRQARAAESFRRTLALELAFHAAPYA